MPFLTLLLALTRPTTLQTTCIYNSQYASVFDPHNPEQWSSFNIKVELNKKYREKNEMGINVFDLKPFKADGHVLYFSFFRRGFQFFPSHRYSIKLPGVAEHKVLPYQVDLIKETYTPFLAWNRQEIRNELICNPLEDMFMVDMVRLTCSISITSPNGESKSFEKNFNLQVKKPDYMTFYAHRSSLTLVSIGSMYMLEIRIDGKQFINHGYFKKGKLIIEDKKFTTIYKGDHISTGCYSK